MQPKQKVPTPNTWSQSPLHTTSPILPYTPGAPCSRGTQEETPLGEQHPTTFPRSLLVPQGGGEGQGSHRGARLTSNTGVVGDAHDAVGVVGRRRHLARAASAVPARRNPIS